MAALHYLKYPTAVKLGSVAADGPAKDTLKAGDQLLGIAGQADRDLAGRGRRRAPAPSPAP